MSAAEIWNYDDSLGALLIMTARALDLARGPDLVTRVDAKAEATLFDGASLSLDPPSLEAIEEAAQRIKASSIRLYAAALRAWMSEEEIETDLLAVAADCASRGELALGDFSRPALARLAATVRRVSKETHLLEGFARFSPRRDGRYVALLEPTHNVLPALAPFFLGRFGPEAFALVDLKRGFALASEPTGAESSIRFIEGEELSAILPDQADEETAALWKKYFSIVENISRRNKGLQRQLMPARYWKHLTELMK